MAEATKYLETTDENDPKGPQVGVHSVDADTRLPLASEGQTYRWISEEEARAAHPALFGVVKQLTDEEIDEQIAALQELRDANTAAKAASETKPSK